MIVSISTYNNTVAYTPVEVDNFLVVPVVMMVEGVHKGSHGAIYHSVKAFNSGVKKWEGKPITLRHPVNAKGSFVSVNEVDADTWVIGYVKNARVAENKLKADAYFDVNKIVALSPELMDYLRSGKTMEVSIGVFSLEMKQQGVWNNEEYNAVAINHEPDHLALLPGEVGACSIMDGCGLRVNNEVNINEKKEDTIMCEKCKDKAKAIVANVNTHFTDADLEWLETLSEDKLDKMIPMVKTVEVNKTVEVEKEVTPERAWEVLGLNKAQYDKGVEFYNQKRNEVIEKITANTEDGVWDKADLDEMKLETLEKLAKSVVPKVQANQNQPQQVAYLPPIEVNQDFNGGSTSEGVRPLLPNGVEVKN